MLRTTTQWDGIPGSPYFTVLHFEGTDAAEASAVHALTVELWDAMANYRTSIMTGQVLPEVEVVDVATGNVTATFAEPTAPVAAGTSGARQPYVVQGLVQARTGVYDAGREIRGRTFLPGTIDASDTDGVPSSAYITAISAIWSTFLTDGTTAGVPPVIWSPTKGLSAPVAFYTVWNQWAILRSRRD